MIKNKSVLVTQTARSDPLQFRVTVSTDGTRTEHVVTISERHCQDLTSGRYFAAQLVEASFLFLLDREPKEAMLRRFDLTLISRYFPEFEQQLPQYLARIATSSAGVSEQDDI